MAKSLSSSAQKVQDALNVHGLPCEVFEMPNTTRTAGDAARVAGCKVGQIVKSLVFKGVRTDKPYLVLASGANRVNEKQLGKIVDEPVKMPNADFVRQKTGFVIGGVPPLGHTEKLETFIDEDLLPYDEIWAAAGTPHAIFKISPTDLQKITAGRVVGIK